MTDDKRMRALWLAHMLSDYGIAGAGGDEAPDQQRFGADCVEAAALLMEAAGFRRSMTQESLYDKAGLMRKKADELEEAEDRALAAL